MVIFFFPPLRGAFCFSSLFLPLRSSPLLLFEEREQRLLVSVLPLGVQCIARRFCLALAEAGGFFNGAWQADIHDCLQTLKEK
jgi:hypothetical protein